jgi:pilus assembly protein CpaE
MAQAAKIFSGAKDAVRFIACIADEVTREAVSRAAQSLGWNDVTVRAGGIADAPHVIDRKRPPALLLVDLTDHTDPVPAVAQLIEMYSATTRILALGAVNDVGLFRSLMSLGVADYLVKPVSSELLCDAFNRAIQQDEAQNDGPRGKHLYAFIGARGGVGSTTLAVATAWLLAHEYKLRTALVDLDLHFGNLALSLDLEPGRGLREALEHPERTDNLLLQSAMVKEGDRLPILAAEEPLEEMFHFDGESATSLLEALSQDHDFMIVDVPRSLNGVCRQVLAAADTVVVVTDLSLASLRDTLRLNDLVKSLGSKSKPLLVANHVGAAHRGEIGRAEFERGLGAPLDAAIPFDAKAAVAMARGGKALPTAAGSSKATIELRALASRLSGKEPKARTGLRRWFS